MRSHAARVLGRCWVLAVAVILLVGLAQGPAHAATPPYKCTAANVGSIWTDEYGFKYSCRHVGNGVYKWVIVISMDGQKTNAKLYSTSNPTSYQAVSVGIRQGSGGGVYEGGQTIADANGNDMSRPMRTRVIVKHYLTSIGWVTCHDSGWINNGIKSWSHNGFDMGAAPDCGPGVYGVKAAGLYWSGTLNRWLGGAWLLSGNIELGGTVAPPNVPPMTDDPLNLPPPP